MGPRAGINALKSRKVTCSRYGLTLVLRQSMGRDSSVGKATRYGLGPGIESRWGARFSAPVQAGPGSYTVSCTMGTGCFPGE